MATTEQQVEVLLRLLDPIVHASLPRETGVFERSGRVMLRNALSPQADKRADDEPLAGRSFGGGEVIVPLFMILGFTLYRWAAKQRTANAVVDLNRACDDLYNELHLVLAVQSFSDSKKATLMNIVHRHRNELVASMLGVPQGPRHPGALAAATPAPEQGGSDRRGSDGEALEALVPEMMIQSIFTAALATSLHDDRAALLAGINPSIVATLPLAGNPGGQMLIDLRRLNVLRGSTGMLPLRIWLENAMMLRSAHRECKSFAEARDAIANGRGGGQ